MDNPFKKIQEKLEKLEDAKNKEMEDSIRKSKLVEEKRLAAYDYYSNTVTRVLEQLKNAVYPEMEVRFLESSKRNSYDPTSYEWNIGYYTKLWDYYINRWYDCWEAQIRIQIIFDTKDNTIPVEFRCVRQNRKGKEGHAIVEENDLIKEGFAIVKSDLKEVESNLTDTLKDLYV